MLGNEERVLRWKKRSFSLLVSQHFSEQTTFYFQTLDFRLFFERNYEDDKHT